MPLIRAVTKVVLSLGKIASLDTHTHTHPLALQTNNTHTKISGWESCGPQVIGCPWEYI